MDPSSDNFRDLPMSAAILQNLIDQGALTVQEAAHVMACHPSTVYDKLAGRPLSYDQARALMLYAPDDRVFFAFQADLSHGKRVAITPLPDSLDIDGDGDVDTDDAIASAAAAIEQAGKAVFEMSTASGLARDAGRCAALRAELDRVIGHALGAREALSECERLAGRRRKAKRLTSPHPSIGGAA